MKHSHLHIALLLTGFLGTLALGQVLLPEAEAAAEPPTAEGKIAVMGDSLARVGGLNLAQILDYVAIDECSRSFHNGCKAGMHLGDHFARAVRAADEGARGALLELNIYIFNERVHLGTPRPRHVVTRDHKHVTELYGAASPRLWYALFRQAGIDTVAAAHLKERSPLYARGAEYRVDLRRRIGRQILARFDKERLDPELIKREGEANQRAFFGTNFRRKRLVGGVDDLVLEELLDWISSEAPGAIDFAFFVPPLNRAVIDDLAPGRWDDFQAWITTVRERAAERSVPLLDYSRFYAEEPDRFKDYGHLAAPESMQQWALALLEDVRGLGWCD